MNGEKSVLDCKTCGESGFNWQHGEFSGVACRSGPHVEVLKTPAWLKLGVLLERHGNTVAGFVITAIFIALCAGVVATISFFGGEGPATFCYLKGHYSTEKDNKGACLYAHVEWKGDRFLGCWETNTQAIYERDTVLKCPSEFQKPK